MSNMQTQTAPLIDARNVAVTFKVEGGTIEAVRDVSFTVWPGKTTALVGESGSGKSVTARAVMRLLSKRATVGEGRESLFAATWTELPPKGDAAAARQTGSL
jgi:peptide/nickel transport system ATP-binding protein